MKTKTELQGYPQLLKDVQSILEKGLGRAYKAVDNIKVQTYWQVGERVVREELQNKERADYGGELIKELAVDLNIHERTMYRICHFYAAYPILTTVLSELSWSHYLVLIDIKEQDERKFYEVQSVRESWSVRELRKKIKEGEFSNAKKEGKIVTKLPLQLSAPEDVFKESYNWNFLELEESHNEKQLESALLDNIQKTLLEFGQGFAFMGNQQKVLIAEQWHKVDLLFYHRFLKSIIVVELKTEKFKPEFIGQMNKYLTYFMENKLEDEREPIGLLICREKNHEEVHYALGKLKKEIFVAEYQTHLPSEEEIKNSLK